jgi:ACR3 family arsenite efflux pump ArsB
MMIPSNLIFLQLYIVVLFMVTRTATTKVSQSVEEASQSYNNQVCLFIYFKTLNIILYILATSNSCSYRTSSSSNQR